MLAPLAALANPVENRSVTDESRSPDEAVVLLHGLGRTRFSMARLERVFRRDGYFVLNRTYPSRRMKIDSMSLKTIDPLIKACWAAGCRRIHFVTHSMGGILVRAFMAQNPDVPELKNSHIVMLAPPNNGSQIVDRFGHTRWFRCVFGPGACQLRTGADGYPATLGEAPATTGVIAGTHTWDPIFSRYLPGPHDGKVTVENTRLGGMKDHLTAPVTHTFIAWSSPVIRQCRHFVRHGAFAK